MMLRALKIAIIVIAAVMALAVIVGTYFALDFVWSITHPRYRHVPTAEVTSPTNPTFHNCWNDSSKRFVAGLVWTGASGQPNICDADGTYLPLNNDPVMILTVLVPKAHPGPAGAPAMQIAVTSLCGVSSKYLGETAILPEVSGNPPIVCNLNAVEAAYVRSNGVPQSLIDAMHTTARTAGWKPLASSSKGTTTQTPPVNVSSAGHFP